MTAGTEGIDSTRIPNHIACVMDGNGRWAAQQGLKRTEGHIAGEEALFDVVDGAIELGVNWLTVYAFSTENWSRPSGEVRFLMNFNRTLLGRRRDELHDRGIRLRFIGRRDWRVPKGILRAMDDAAELTRSNHGMTLTFAFNYGGRAEIIDAVKALVAEGVPADKISEKSLRRHLYAPDMPDPDLVIRTSGEYRISNFLLWELAYSELLFSPVYWPDFRRDHLYDAIREFQARDRRFGKVRGAEAGAMAQGLYRDQGIVLRTWKLGEADRIASLLTRRHGKVRVVAKGARKTRSRFGARVEPGTHLALQLYAGRSELETLAQAEAIEPMTAIRNELGRLGRAAVLLEVADHASIDRQPNEPLYQLLLGALRALEQSERALIVAGFVLKMLALEGVQPDVYHCIGCGTDEDLVAFDAAGGGVRCRACRLGLALPPAALAIMRAILGGQLRVVIDLPTSDVTNAVEHAALSAAEHHLDRRVRSAGMHLDAPPA